ncbi:MAG: glycoside hydrolase family 3 protein, partial [Treponema sp.]|nr:glycoside hydrolase family 3 protein [Treponema sp.]
DDPVQVGILGTAFMKGQLAAGVIATAKHYPGHGDTELDSHGILPEISAPFEVLWERELIPYRFLIKEGLRAIMSGHLAFPNTPAGMIPASLSPWFLKDVLRDKIGFQGIIITDDLMMNGATMSAGSLSQAAKQALLAGNDILMLSRTPNLYESIWTYLVASMEQEPEFRERVRNAAQRVLEIKLCYLRGDKAVPWIPDLKLVETNIPDPEGKAFFLDLAARSVTMVKGDEVFPLTPQKAGKVLLAGKYEDFFTIGKQAYPGAVSYAYAPDGSTAELVRYAQAADTVIFCLFDADGLTFLRRLQALGKRIIVFSVLNPVYLLDEALWVDGAIAVYSYARESFIAGFSVLLGRIPAGGKLPFPLHQGASPHG